MKKCLSGLFEYGGIEYEYTAVIYSGEDSYTYPDQVVDLDRSDGKPIGKNIWEDVEFMALQNAYLVEWCEKEGWDVEDAGDGCSALTKVSCRITTRITRVDDLSAPQRMGEMVSIGRYIPDDTRLESVQIFNGGITEWLSEEYARGASAYAPLIKKVAAELGRPSVNPRWVEAFMRLEYPSLNGVSTESFEREVAVAISCIDALGCPGI